MLNLSSEVMELNTLLLQKYYGKPGCWTEEKQGRLDFVISTLRGQREKGELSVDTCGKFQQLMEIYGELKARRERNALPSEGTEEGARGDSGETSSHDDHGGQD